MAADIEKRLDALERRIIRLETLQRGGDAAAVDDIQAAEATPEVAAVPSSDSPRDVLPDFAEITSPEKPARTGDITRILGWGGATALVALDAVTASNVNVNGTAITLAGDVAAA